MTEKNRQLIERAKPAVIKEAMQMRRLNKEVPVSGSRESILLSDRKIGFIYYPAARTDAPLIIGFHGGGYLFGGSALNDHMWSSVRDVLGMNVASVEYRKSPQYQYMDAIEDAQDAADYLRYHAAEFGFDPAKIYVMGASAGAGLAASACIYARQQHRPQYTGQILLYPFLDCYTDPDSKGKGSLSGPIMYIFNELHCRPEEARDPLASPVFAEAELLRGLPPAVILYAGDDSLKHEGMQYAAKLRSVGVPVTDKLFPGIPHGFFESGFDNPESATGAFLSDRERELLRDGTLSKAAGEALAFIKENL